MAFQRSIVPVLVTLMISLNILTTLPRIVPVRCFPGDWCRSVGAGARSLPITSSVRYWFKDRYLTACQSNLKASCLPASRYYDVIHQPVQTLMPRSEKLQRDQYMPISLPASDSIVLMRDRCARTVNHRAWPQQPLVLDLVTRTADSSKLYWLIVRSYIWRT